MTLKFKFLMPVLLLFVLFFMLFTYSEHKLSTTTLEQTIRTQAQSLTKMIQSVRIVYHKKFLAGTFPIPPETSTFLPSHSMTEISNKLNELSPAQGTRFRNPRTTPINTMANATTLEKKAFSFFSNHPNQHEHLEPFYQNGELFYQYSTPTFLESYCFSCHPEMTFSADSLNGILSITLSAQQLKDQALKRQNTNLMIMLISFAACCIATVLLFNQIINKKLKTLHAISQKNSTETFKKSAHNGGNDELDEIILSMNQMSEEMKKREDDLLSAYEFSTTILNNISDAVCVIAPETQTIIAVNGAFLAMHNTTRAKVIGSHCHDIIACESSDPTKKGSPCPGCYAAQHKVPCREERTREIDGQKFYYDVCVSPILNEQGNTIQTVRVARNITQAKIQEQQISQLAYFDSLTGLPNRSLFHDRLTQSLRLSSREGSCGIIAFLDLDKFKEINDRFGHSAGDEVLKTVADRLSSCVRESDTVARMCGDEFLIIYHNSCQNEHAKKLAETLLHALSEPIMIKDEIITTSTSVGLCFFPRDGNSVDELLKHADDAMYRAKHAGRNTYHIYTNDAQPTLF